MSASTLSSRTVTRLPVPHLFMVLSLGIFALMAVLAFAPATAADGEPGATVVEPDAGLVLAMDAGTPVASVARADTSPVPPTATSDGLAFASLGVLAGLLLVTFRAGRMQSHGSGRPVLGLGAGLLAGVAAATSLFNLGVIAPASPTWVYLPVVFATLGTALGLTAPFQRTASQGLASCSS